MELRDAFRRRKMVRSFRPDPVPAEVLDDVMRAVLHAPSAGFTQGNEFLVLTDVGAVQEFFDLTDLPEFPMTAEERAVLPPVVILPLANREAYVSRYTQPDKIAFGLDEADHWPVPFWDIDAGMASMLILLAAVEHGLGALFAGIAHGEAGVLARFGVPAQFHPIGVIHLGYPAEVDEISAHSSARTRRRRPLEELLHRNGW